MDALENLQTLYGKYVDTFRTAEGTLPPMMQLKLDHTARVVENARAIATGEAFDAATARVALAAALLHDTGRYEQLRRWNTFRDSESVDHAVFSCEIVKGKGWLETVPELDAAARGAVLTAVRVHNMRTIPEAEMDAVTCAASHTVRDADKLDIFRVLEDQIAHTDWRKDARAFWNLPTVRPPNPAVLEAIRARRPVDYQAIASLADFVLIQVGWMLSDLHFATSRQLCVARGHLEYRRRFLKELTDSPAVDEICDLAAGHLASEGKENML